MAKLKPSDIKEAILKVIRGAATVGSLDSPEEQASFLTAYKILDRLPKAMRTQLLKEHGKPRATAASYFSAAMFVAQSAARLEEVEVRWLDTNGLSILLNGKEVSGASPVCALYGVRRA